MINLKNLYRILRRYDTLEASALKALRVFAGTSFAVFLIYVIWYRKALRESIRSTFSKLFSGISHLRQAALGGGRILARLTDDIDGYIAVNSGDVPVSLKRAAALMRDEDISDAIHNVTKSLVSGVKAAISQKPKISSAHDTANPNDDSQIVSGTSNDLSDDDGLHNLHDHRPDGLQLENINHSKRLPHHSSGTRTWEKIFHRVVTVILSTRGQAVITGVSSALLREGIDAVMLHKKEWRELDKINPQPIVGASPVITAAMDFAASDRGKKLIIDVTSSLVNTALPVYIQSNRDNSAPIDAEAKAIRTRKQLENIVQILFTPENKSNLCDLVRAAISEFVSTSYYVKKSSKYGITKSVTSGNDPINETTNQELVLLLEKKRWSLEHAENVTRYYMFILWMVLVIIVSSILGIFPLIGRKIFRRSSQISDT